MDRLNAHFQSTIVDRFQHLCHASHHFLHLYSHMMMGEFWSLFVFSCSNNVKKSLLKYFRPNSTLMYSLILSGERIKSLSWKSLFTSSHSFSFRLPTQQLRFISFSWAQTWSLKLRLLWLSAIISALGIFHLLCPSTQRE